MYCRLGCSLWLGCSVFLDSFAAKALRAAVLALRAAVLAQRAAVVAPHTELLVADLLAERGEHKSKVGLKMP